MDNLGYTLRFESGNNASLHHGTDLEETGTAPRLPKRRMPQKFKRRPNAERNAWEEPPLAAIGTLTRTKRLLLAALRVWELKQGIRD
jgi:hypothetical protein